MSDELFRWFIAGGVLLSTVAFVVQAVAVLVLVRKASAFKAKVEPLVSKASPIIDNVRLSVQDLTPKVKLISADAVDISKNAREQVHRVGELLTDFSDRAKAQVARIDGVVDETIGNVEHAGESVVGAVLKPVREVNGVLSGIKTAISVYAHGRQQSVDHATQDEEMFI